MGSQKHFDVIIIGGSYAGLSAAMALGRSLRNVLVIDSGLPCNRQTPHSHNFLTGDGETPAAIAEKAKAQVLKYDTIKFHRGLVTEASGSDNAFEVVTEAGERFSSGKLLFATGLSDIMPPLEGFAACWGISVLHCPYCHGYEVKGQKTGILADGEMGIEFLKLISNWTADLTLFTNGKPEPTEDQLRQSGLSGFTVIRKAIGRVDHQDGKLTHLVFADGSKQALTALYARPVFRQHCPVPESLGCELSEAGFLKVDGFQKTTVPGVYAAGDNTTGLRAVSVAIAAGTKAGAVLNKELIDQRF